MKKLSRLFGLGILIILLLAACGGNAAMNNGGEAMPETAVSQPTTTSTDNLMPDNMSDDMADDMDTMNDNMADDMPGDMNENMSDDMNDNMSDDMNDNMSDDMDTMNENMGDDMSGDMNESMSDTMSDDMNDNMNENMEDDMDHEMSDDMDTMNENMSDDMSGDMNDNMNENMDEGMSDDMMSHGPDWLNLPLTNARTGEIFTLADFSGKTVFVETMATWCSNCRSQLQNVREAKSQVDGDEIMFVALSVETNITADDLANYADNEGFDWLFAVATPELLQALANEYSPTITNPPSTPHFIVRPDGSITDLVTGIDSPDTLVSDLTSAAMQ